MAESKRTYEADILVPRSQRLQPREKYDKHTQKEERGNSVYIRTAFSEQMLVRLIDRIKDL
jgi:hypothetical protein